jgi:hypothetical protein
VLTIAGSPPQEIIYWLVSNAGRSLLGCTDPCYVLLGPATTRETGAVKAATSKTLAGCILDARMQVTEGQLPQQRTEYSSV